MPIPPTRSLAEGGSSVSVDGGSRDSDSRGSGSRGSDPHRSDPHRSGSRRAGLRASRARALPHRLPERMDRPDCPPERLSEALRTIARANRWSGGERLLRREVLRLLAGRTPGPLRLLDVGSGDGTGVLRLARRLARRGWRPRILLTDRHAATLPIAREREATRRWSRRAAADGVGFVRLDAAALPFADGAVDVAVSTAVLHHLEADEAVAFLRELERVSRIGWAVADLRRSLLGYAAVRFMAATAWRRKPLNRADGPVSVRRAFTGEEARGLLRRAGLDRARVRVRPLRLAVRSVA